MLTFDIGLECAHRSLPTDNKVVGIAEGRDVELWKDMVCWRASIPAVEHVLGLLSPELLPCVFLTLTPSQHWWGADIGKAWVCPCQERTWSIVPSKANLVLPQLYLEFNQAVLDSLSFYCPLHSRLFQKWQVTLILSDKSEKKPVNLITSRLLSAFLKIRCYAYMFTHI